MGRSLAAGVFLLILAVGVILAFISNGGSDEIGAPPDQLVQFDEQATAAFSDSAATRETVNQVGFVVAITLGVTGLIVVAAGRLDE